MATATPESASYPISTIHTRNRPTYACTRCADRKVKCDRQSPCSSCVKHNADCVFNPAHSLPPRKRQKRVADQILTDRLRYYEALLQDHGIDPTKLPATPTSDYDQTAAAVLDSRDVQEHTPSIICFERDLVNKTQVIHNHGRFKFVDNSLWTRVVEELHSPEDALEDSSNEASDQEESDGDFGFMLDHQSKSSTKSPNHPSPERIQQLWRIFTENVDPLTKIVHVPTLQPAIQKAVSNLKAVPRTFEPLMFAIYSAAVMSLRDDECKQTFGETRKNLLSQYLSATKAALSRAKFMGTGSLVVLQALILHLLVVRDIYEQRAVWSLTGVAIRIAEGMGLERDGTTLGLPAFETEIRRRVFWWLKSHDYRVAELCGLPKFRDLDSSPERTQWPTNVNDAQLYSGMPALLTDSTTLTDNAFVCLRYELTKFAVAQVARFRQQGKNPSNFHLHAFGLDKTEMGNAFKAAEELLETKYLRFCDPSQPLHLMILVTARYALNIMRFLSHHPRRWAAIGETPLAERQWVWEVSIKLLEQHNMMQMSPQLKQFAWSAPHSLQWHAFIHILDTLRANPRIADAEKLWQLIGNTYEHTPAMIFDTKTPTHVAVGNLCLKAYHEREASLAAGENGQIPSQPTPDFILQLRQQHELAKAARQSKQSRPAPSEPLLVADLSSALETTNLQRPAAPRTPQSEADSFWHLNGFDDGSLGGAMNVNLDVLLALPQDQSMEDVNAITWEQWDAWLADSNLVRLQKGS